MEGLESQGIANLWLPSTRFLPLSWTPPLTLREAGVNIWLLITFTSNSKQEDTLRGISEIISISTSLHLHHLPWLTFIIISNSSKITLIFPIHTGNRVNYPTVVQLKKALTATAITLTSSWMEWIRICCHLILLHHYRRHINSPTLTRSNIISSVSVMFTLACPLLMITRKTSPTCLNLTSIVTSMIHPHLPAVVLLVIDSPLLMTKGAPLLRPLQLDNTTLIDEPVDSINRFPHPFLPFSDLLFFPHIM